ncbi:MAG: hypothetical protein ABF820_13530 [Sporolactobacillus sp.]
MEIVVKIPALDHLATAIEDFAVVLGDKGTFGTLDVLKAVTTGAPQHPDEAPAPAVGTQQTQQPQAVPTTTVAPVAPARQAAAQTVPTTAPTYSLDKLAAAGAQLMDAGKQNDLINLLNNQFGVQALTMLKPEQYGSFATALRQLGAAI